MQYVSGMSGAKSDCKIAYEPRTSGNLEVQIESKVESLFGVAIRKTAFETLHAMNVEHGALIVEDNGALPFVMMARIEAAVRMAHPAIVARAFSTQFDTDFRETARDRFRRSRLYLPGNQPKLMLNAGIHQPDGIILDLEDSVAPAEKFSARIIVRNALRSLDFFGCEKMVRVNQGELGLDEIDELVAHPVHLLLLPKIESAEQVQEVQSRIDCAMKSSGRTQALWLMPIIESALGVLNAYAIAKASPSIVALAIGLEDYTADIGTQRTQDGRESYFARSMIVNAARAAGVQPIDTVFSDVNDMEGLTQSVLEAKALGFDGKGCIHPRQIAPLHAAFAPEHAEIERSKKIVRAFDDATSRGLGVVSLGSKMIDPPVVKRAQRTITLAVTTGILAANWKEIDHN